MLTPYVSFYALSILSLSVKISRTCLDLPISASIYYLWYAIRIFSRINYHDWSRVLNNSLVKASIKRCVCFTTGQLARRLKAIIQYLSKNNGGSNAYTSTTNTNYYFNVTTSALAGALERFSGFFHSPLFAPSCTSRELNAVDSENKKNHQSDVWRIFQLNKHLSKPGHVWSKFGTGNRDSLSRAARELKAQGKLNGVATSKDSSLSTSPSSSRIPSPAPSENDIDGGAVGRETRRRLMQWWAEEYCASRMNLCILGKGIKFPSVIASLG